MTTRKTSLNLPPSSADISKIAYDAIAELPKDFLEFTKNVLIIVEDFPDDDLLLDMGLESPFDLLAYLDKSSELTSDWQTTYTDSKTAKQSFIKQDTLYLYRRPLLDYWCETSEDFAIIVKKAIIGELGSKMGICDDDIEILEDEFSSFFNNKSKK